MRVAICIVSNRDHKGAFSEAKDNLISHIALRGHQYGMESFSIIPLRNASCLSKGRQDMIKLAKQNYSTHILFLDDDMVFSPDVVEILASRKLPVVGANYVGKSLDLNFTAQSLAGNRLDSRGRTGVEEVSHLGFGVLLLELNALINIPAPHFEILWSEKHQEYITEDVYFCNKLRENGIKIHVDHDVSQHVGHIGDFVYTLNGYAGT
jgi:hypothetical protein